MSFASSSEFWDAKEYITDDDAGSTSSSDGDIEDLDPDKVVHYINLLYFILSVSKHSIFLNCLKQKYIALKLEIL